LVASGLTTLRNLICFTILVSFLHYDKLAWELFLGARQTSVLSCGIGEFHVRV